MTPAEIHSLRNSLKMTQAEFAKALLVSTALVEKMEQGTRKATRIRVRDMMALKEKHGRNAK